MMNRVMGLLTFAFAVLYSVPAFAVTKTTGLAPVVTGGTGGAQRLVFPIIAFCFIVGLGCVSLAWWVGPGGAAWRRRWWGV